MYVRRSIEVSSRTQFWSRKAISIAYSECVSVALPIQHANCMGHITLLYLAFLFGEGEEHYVRVDFLYKFI
jgi:hypothetical protein